MFHNLCDFIKDEIKDIDRKISSGGKPSMQELEYADKLAHLKKSLLTVDAMENPDEYRDDGMDRSYNRSYGARRRDSMGRYKESRMYRDDMMDDLHELMEKAPNDRVRHKYNEFINEIQNMM